MYSTRYQTDEQIARENRRLRDEVESYRYEQERQQEERERSAERRHRERREQMQIQAREAHDWPTAFTKNRYLMMRERNECVAPANEDPQYIEMMNDLRANWDRSLAEVDRAAAIWAEEQKAIDAAIQQMRIKVAQRLRAEFPDSNQELAN
jgi:hypothetical protein